MPAQTRQASQPDSKTLFLRAPLVETARSRGIADRCVNKRRTMEAGDWFNAAINAAIGILLGMAADGLLKLATTGFWPFAVLIPLLFLGVFFFVVMFEKMTDRLFPIGIRPAKNAPDRGDTPLLRLLSMPIGALVGVALSRLDLAEPLLGLM